MPFESTGYSFFGGIYTFTALRALRGFWCYERHIVVLYEINNIDPVRRKKKEVKNALLASKLFQYAYLYSKFKNTGNSIISEKEPVKTASRSFCIICIYTTIFYRNEMNKKKKQQLNISLFYLMGLKTKKVTE